MLHLPLIYEAHNGASYVQGIASDMFIWSTNIFLFVSGLCLINKRHLMNPEIEKKRSLKRDIEPASGSPSLRTTNVLFFSWSRMAIFVGVLRYILSTYTNKHWS